MFLADGTLGPGLLMTRIVPKRQDDPAKARVLLAGSSLAIVPTTFVLATGARTGSPEIKVVLVRLSTHRYKDGTLDTEPEKKPQASADRRAFADIRVATRDRPLARGRSPCT